MITTDLYGLLTTEPNAVVAPIHQKAMPVILTKSEEIETWLTALWIDAKALQLPLLDDGLVCCRPLKALPERVAGGTKNQPH